jgi:cytochrome c-type biogenesis protein CcmE
MTVYFTLTDMQKSVPIAYTGILPDLFREGQGIVVHGSIGSDGAFTADEVLAKHDEKYMPPEVAAAIKKAETQAAAAEVKPRRSN